MRILLSFHRFLKNLKNFDFIGFLALRLYLFYIFWTAGTDYLNNFDKLTKWLESLDLGFPEIFSWMVIATEIGGACLLLVGLFVRWAAIPLLIGMAITILSNWQNGWSIESHGIEMAVTYSIMLVILLLSGGGRYFSLDYWISRK